MVGYADDKPWDYKHTLAGELARSGYQTINVGKTHFHPERLRLGFHELVLGEDYDAWIDAETSTPTRQGRSRRNPQLVVWPAEPSPRASDGRGVARQPGNRSP